MSRKTVGAWRIDEETGTRSWVVKILPPDNSDEPVDDQD